VNQGTAGTRHRHQGSRKDPSINLAVLVATRHLLVTRGYSATSIDLIATTAGVSRPAIYRRWSSKAQLVNDAVFPELGPDRPEDDFIAEITRLCHGALRLFHEPAVREAMPGLLLDMRSDPDLYRLLTQRVDASARAQLADTVDHAVAGGAARPGISADIIMDAIAGGAFYAACVRNVQDLDRAATELCDVVLRGAASEPPVKR
jgi:AcrR family transcriptional regulator